MPARRFFSRGDAAEGGNEVGPVDRILRTDGVEIAAHEERPLAPGDQAGKVPRLVLRAAQRVRVIGCHHQLTKRVLITAVSPPRL
jgi:hypothetical protein